MKILRIFQIDAFASDIFVGNPAAVCPLDSWLQESVMQAIAAENNLSETAFLVPEVDGYRIRWFTPREEVPLCGHATLASAFVVFTELEPGKDSVRFQSRSGELIVQRDGKLLNMDFPAYEMERCPEPPADLLLGLNVEPLEVFAVHSNPNYYVLYETEDQVRSITPDFKIIERLHPYGVIVTAPGTDSDCASRYFVPGFGIPEDPVTGSIHSALIPFWAERLHKKKIHARQVSHRGGELYCEDRGTRVQIGGYAVKYLEGTITIPV